jgi:rhodanese-related sulfurtransferase
MRDIMQKIAELDPDRETVVICHHGIRSRRICQLLAMNGFSNLINLSDGIDGWAKTVDLNMDTY